MHGIFCFVMTGHYRSLPAITGHFRTYWFECLPASSYVCYVNVPGKRGDGI